MSTVRAWEESLKKQLESLDAGYANAEKVHPSTVWSTPDVEPEGVIGESFRGKIVLLTQDVFRGGTLRVLAPCKLVLCESIVFNPNSGLVEGKTALEPNRTKDWFPLRDQVAYQSVPPVGTPHGTAASKAFRLGFFAAITIEHGDGTILDLNGFRLSCHPDFALQQRFHALIELANQPFVPGQGPAAFGQELRPARKVWIRNGELGRSPHHGVHGNSMQDVLISDVTFRDYEVAAASLNGGRRILLCDCQLEGTSTNIPILGTYSSARFARLIGYSHLGRVPRYPGYATLSPESKQEVDAEIANLQAALVELDEKLDAVFNAVLTERLTGAAACIDPLFANVDRFADANPYGIAIHARGVLVNAFLCNGAKISGGDDLARAFECTDVAVRRVNVARTRGNVREVLALAFAEGEPEGKGPVTDSAGAVFRFFPFDTQLASHGDRQPAEMDAAGVASLTAVGKVQMAIAAVEKVAVRLAVMPTSDVLAAKLHPFVEWSKGVGRIVPDASNPTHYRLERDDGKQPVELRLRSNGDLMHHVNKGALGVFIQAVDGLDLDRVIVATVENRGLPGSAKAGPYQGPRDGGHGDQARQVGYSGSDARGIYLGACSNVEADRVQAHGVVSHFGNATGIELAGGSEHVELHSALVGSVSAGHSFRDPREFPVVDENRYPFGAGTVLVEPRSFNSLYPNAPPIALGLLADGTTRNIGIEDFQVSGVIGQPGPRSASKVRIESRLNRVSPSHGDA
ncbi:MAG: hypothetical protein U0939_03670 [Pirellulales bacterium]